MIKPCETNQHNPALLVFEEQRESMLVDYTIGMIGMGLSLAFLTWAAGTVVVPALLIGAVGVFILSAWTMANTGYITWKTVFSRHNVTIGSIFAGLMFAAWMIGPAFSEAFRKIFAFGHQLTPHLAAPGGIMQDALHSLPAGLAPQVQAPAEALNIAIQTALVCKNTLVHPVFAIPIMAIGGMAVNLKRKNSANVFGKFFEEAIAEALAKNIQAETQGILGILVNDVNRPPKGAFSLLDDEDIAQMLEVLKGIGLRNFEHMISIDFYTKSVKINTQDHLEQGVITSELFFRLPLTSKEKASVIFRIVVSYPYYINEKGEKVLFTEIPEWYRKGIMHNLCASSIFNILGEKLPGRFKLSFKKEEFFRKIFGRAVTRTEKEQIPTDIQILKKYMAFGLLHEFTHALVLHMPDEPSIIAMKPDDPEWVKKYPNKAEREKAFVKEQERF